LRKLAASYAQLDVRDRLSFALQLPAALRAGAVGAADALAQLPRFAADDEPEIAAVPLSTLEFAIRELSGPRPERARAFGAAMYKPVADRLGWSGAKEEEQPQRYLRAKVLAFLALEARDPETRAQAAQRGRAQVAGGELHPEAVQPDLALLALAAAIEEDTGPVFESALAVFHASKDPGVRTRVLTALAHARDPRLLDRALALSLDPRLRGNERLTVVEKALERPHAREQAWRWMKANFEALAKLVPEGYLAFIPKLPATFCDEEHRQDVRAFFAPRAEKTRGMPRNLAQADERMKLCAAQRKALAPGAQAFFERRQISAR
jgi:alanyl aminopeptidase